MNSPMISDRRLACSEVAGTLPLPCGEVVGTLWSIALVDLVLALPHKRKYNQLLIAQTSRRCNWRSEIIGGFTAKADPPMRSDRTVPATSPQASRKAPATSP